MRNGGFEIRGEGFLSSNRDSCSKGKKVVHSIASMVIDAR